MLISRSTLHILNVHNIRSCGYIIMTVSRPPIVVCPSVHFDDDELLYAFGFHNLPPPSSHGILHRVMLCILSLCHTFCRCDAITYILVEPCYASSHYPIPSVGVIPSQTSSGKAQRMHAVRVVGFFSQT